MTNDPCCQGTMSEEMKARLAGLLEFLWRRGVIPQDFTGRLVFNFNVRHLCSIKRVTEVGAIEVEGVK